MNKEELLVQVAFSIHQSREQAEDTINAIRFVFNKLHKKSYSYETICKMILEAAEEDESGNPDVQFIGNWLKSV
jgi:hypothetical protein